MHSEYLLLASALLTSFVLTYLFIPSIIKIAEIKHLFDTEHERKSHTGVIPTLGGVGIFGGFMIGFSLFARFNTINDRGVNQMKYIIAALCFTFMMGVKDDIVELVANKKFIGQIFAACIIVILGDIRLTSLYGLFGISYIDYAPSVILSVTTIIFIINAFNIIDGINLLAGSICILMSAAFGSWFFFYGFYDYAVLAAAMSGAVFAFLRYNYTPAKIFMGDSGSLSIGLLAGVLAIQFIEMNELVLQSGKSGHLHITASPSMAIAILIIPLYDTLRAFTLRILNRKSPFLADRNHIHHRLIDIGFSHVQATAILIGVNLLFIVLAYLLQSWGNLYLMLFELGLAMALTFVLFFFNFKKKMEAEKKTRFSKLSMEMEMRDA